MKMPVNLNRRDAFKVGGGLAGVVAVGGFVDWMDETPEDLIEGLSTKVQAEVEKGVGVMGKSGQITKISVHEELSLAMGKAISDLSEKTQFNQASEEAQEMIPGMGKGFFYKAYQEALLKEAFAHRALGGQNIDALRTELRYQLRDSGLDGGSPHAVSVLDSMSSGFDRHFMELYLRGYRLSARKELIHYVLFAQLQKRNMNPQKKSELFEKIKQEISKISISLPEMGSDIEGLKTAYDEIDQKLKLFESPLFWDQSNLDKLFEAPAQ